MMLGTDSTKPKVLIYRLTGIPSGRLTVFVCKNRGRQNKRPEQRVLTDFLNSFGHHNVLRPEAMVVQFTLPAGFTQILQFSSWIWERHLSQAIKPAIVVLLLLLLLLRLLYWCSFARTYVCMYVCKHIARSSHSNANTRRARRRPYSLE